jgi:hypothetical protein
VERPAVKADAAALAGGAIGSEGGGGSCVPCFFSVPFHPTEQKNGTIPFLVFFEPNTGTEPFHDVGMEPFRSIPSHS